MRGVRTTLKQANKTHQRTTYYICPTSSNTTKSAYIIERSKWAAAVLFGPGALSAASVAEYAAQLGNWNTANLERLFAEL
jgi:hypothetical protein